MRRFAFGMTGAGQPGFKYQPQRLVCVMAANTMFSISPSFSPMPALMGGLALGIVCSIRFMMWGKITGISGMASSMVKFPMSGDVRYNIPFVLGLVSMGLIMKVRNEFSLY